MRSWVPLIVLALSGCTSPTAGNGNGDDSGPSADSPDAGGTLPGDAGVGANDGGGSESPPPDAPPPPPIKVLRGVDRASAFSTSEAKTLSTSDAVKWTGVYIGGPCNAGSGWTKALVTTLANDYGWTFMPIYVGRQTSSICSADTLTAAQGTTDGKAAVAEMQTFGWGANKQIPVCLDLEAGTYGAEPNSSLAYAKAWLAAVRAGGYLGYIYSNPDGINGLYDAGAKFDGAWPASWFYTSFQSVKPSDLDQLGTRYNGSNRAWQYASFNSAVGGIDADASDLLLAPAPGGTNL